ncbi:hypothetical protein C8R46DRAFT_1309223 [Mycena filopes]|nr:hypothetical protein C8R46DRAFT_1309223 [Mycena filopes]
MVMKYPEDIVRLILETTASHYPKTIDTLMKISRPTEPWLKPFKYRSILIARGRERSKSDPSKAAEPDYPVTPAMRAHYAAHPDLETITVGEDILKAFQSHDAAYASKIPPLTTGLRDLTFAPASVYPPDLLATLAKLKANGGGLRCFTGSLERLFSSNIGGIDLSHPAFSSLTHLEIWEDLAQQPELRSTLLFLTRLTHLAFEVELGAASDLVRDAPMLNDILAQFPDTTPTDSEYDPGRRKFQVLLLVIFSENGAGGALELPVPPADTTDPRVVITGSLISKTTWRHGPDPAAVDRWEVAESFVARKAAGEIPSAF